MKLIFIGSGALGLPTLRALAHQHQLLAVYTVPDRPAGRGYHLRPSPVKCEALQLNLPLRQPQRVNQAAEEIAALGPEALVVASFGQLLRPALIEIPRLGTINLHASLLPAYRGAAPIQWALLRGEPQTGVTTFLIDEGLDTGAILLQRACDISSEDTAGTLETKLAELGAELMLESLAGLARGRIQPQPQDEALVSYAPKIPKALARLDWSKPAVELANLIRALNPAPGAYTFYDGKRVKIYAGRVVKAAGERARPGEVISVSTEGLLVMTGAGALELLEVQPESKPRMRAADFARGYRVRTGGSLGTKP